MNVFILLDRTGSMSNMWNEAVNSVNAYVEELAKDKKGKHKVTLAVFDYSNGVQFDVLRDAQPIKEWKPFSVTEVTPRGMTPLLDCLARVVNLAEEANSKKTVIVVMTDGYENCSREVTKEQAKAAVERCKNRNWQVVFLGADFNAFGQAQMVGVNLHQTMNFSLGKSEYVMRRTAVESLNYCNTGAAISYTDDVRSQAGEDTVSKR